MRILLCNKFYYRRGGDCIYTLNLEALLKAQGHDVAVFAMEHPDTLDTPWRRYFPPEVNLSSASSKARFFLRSLGGGGTASRFKSLLKEFKPDVVHLNNIHSQLSPVIADIAHKCGCKVVWTLHDYKLLCPRYDCMRHGTEPCDLCFSDKNNVLKQKCMKDSLPASIMAYCEAVRWNRDTLETCTDAFICPSHFMKSKMEQGGFNPAKLHTVCNFIDTEKCRRDDYTERGDYYCYVGRLSTEKGVETLARVAASLPHKLVVIGDGPLKETLPKSSGIEYVGRKDWGDIKHIAGLARFLVIPSECFENNPLSVIEALCLGTPVLGARIGGIPELIDEGTDGLCFESGNEEAFARKIEKMFSLQFDYTAIATAAQVRFSAETYYARIMEIYKA